ncbi:helix-turn-helix domain-containing protein [Streptomyces sp. NPDC005784]|uniref:helix-turn-helix domain-containing protein n=1 Tax=Streptomyces sp. NPDC005784 TaxID=3364731 RepID=UPI0036A35651
MTSQQTDRTQHRPVVVRKVDDVVTLKALGDPLRLAILRVLMRDTGGQPNVRSAKELAQELGEQQTKLYRHIKQLHTCGLIETAGTRLVSGIVEHRYQASQSSLVLDCAFFNSQRGTADAAATIAAAFDDSRTEYLEAAHAGRMASSHLEPITVGVSETIPAAKAAEFRERLAGLIQELHETEHDDEGIQVRLFTVFYGLAEAEA